MRVLVFGASSAQGYWDTKGGWVDRLKLYYYEIQMRDFSKDISKVMNLGVSDDTTNHILKRLPYEAQARENAKGISFVIQVGSNNAATLGSRPRSTPQKYKAELADVISLAKEYSKFVLIVGFPAVDENRTDPLPWANMSFLNKDLKIYEGAAKEVCESMDVPFVPIHQQFTNKIESGEDLWSHDGLHPNDAGHQLILELVRPQLDKLLNS